MNYLCLCYYDMDAFSKLTPSDAQAIRPACEPHDAALKATGKLIVQASLSSPESWSHLVPRAGKPNLVKGRYIQGSKQAGAFFIIEADSEAEALSIASKHAAANFGGHLGFAVEVRPCERFETYKAI